MYAKGWQSSADWETSWVLLGATGHATTRLPPCRGALIPVPSFPLPPLSSITPGAAVGRLGRQMPTSHICICWQKSGLPGDLYVPVI